MGARAEKNYRRTIEMDGEKVTHYRLFRHQVLNGILEKVRQSDTPWQVFLECARCMDVREVGYMSD